MLETIMHNNHANVLEAVYKKQSRKTLTMYKEEKRHVIQSKEQNIFSNVQPNEHIDRIGCYKFDGIQIGICLYNLHGGKNYL